MVLVVCLGLIGRVVQGGLFGDDSTTASSTSTTAKKAGKQVGKAVKSAYKSTKGPATVLLNKGTTKTGTGKVTFSAVGDNLANKNILELADAQAGATDDGTYNFKPFYKNVKKVIKSYDISFVNQETTLGGDDAYGYNGYPSYNTPDSMADAVASVGWDVVSCNTNHTYDTWTNSIEHSHEVWAKKKKRLLTIGSYTSEDDRDAVRVVQCNGLRIAFLSYCYGQNGYEQSDLPNDYYAVPYSQDIMKEDVARARKVADAVVVYMHWGTEYQNDPSDTQKTQAQQLADEGVDLVIGSHVHVIQPMEWLNGNGGKTLVVYGMGDFLSNYQKATYVLSGMFSCTFKRIAHPKSKKGATVTRRVKIADVVWHPMVEHWEGNSDTVRFLKGYTDKEARANELTTNVDDPLAWLKQQTRDVIGSDFTIDM